MTSRSSRSPSLGSIVRTIPSRPPIDGRSPTSSGCAREGRPVATTSFPLAQLIHVLEVAHRIRHDTATSRQKGEAAADTVVAAAAPAICYSRARVKREEYGRSRAPPRLQPVCSSTDFARLRLTPSRCKEGSSQGSRHALHATRECASHAGSQRDPLPLQEGLSTMLILGHSRLSKREMLVLG